MALKEMALFCLGMAEDYLSTYQRSWRWLHGLNSGYTEDYLRKVLAGKGLVDEEKVNGLRLLEQGRSELQRQFPLLQWRNKKWDGIWRVVMYDIPEKQRDKRDKLRYWLKRMGFGKWQISVWVSSHPLAEMTNRFFDEAGLSDVCGIYEARRFSGISDGEFAGKVWRLKTLNDKYRQILGSFDVSKREEYLRLLMMDPMLPKELLPENWLGDRAIKRLIEK